MVDIIFTTLRTAHIIVAVLILVSVVLIAVINTRLMRLVEPSRVVNSLSLARKVRLILNILIYLAIVIGLFLLFLSGIIYYLTNPVFYSTGIGLYLMVKLILVLMLTGLVHISGRYYRMLSSNVNPTSGNIKRSLLMTSWAAFILTIFIFLFASMV